MENPHRFLYHTLRNIKIEIYGNSLFPSINERIQSCEAKP